MTAFKCLVTPTFSEVATYGSGLPPPAILIWLKSFGFALFKQDWGGEGDIIW
jgi:hypothetical protein